MKFSKMQAIFSRICDEDTNASQRQRLRRFLFYCRCSGAMSGRTFICKLLPALPGAQRRIFRLCPEGYQDEEPKAAEMQRILRALATKILAVASRPSMGFSDTSASCAS